MTSVTVFFTLATVRILVVISYKYLILFRKYTENVC